MRIPSTFPSVLHTRQGFWAARPRFGENTTGQTDENPFRNRTIAQIVEALGDERVLHNNPQVIHQGEKQLVEEILTDDIRMESRNRTEAVIQAILAQRAYVPSPHLVATLEQSLHFAPFANKQAPVKSRMHDLETVVAIRQKMVREDYRGVAEALVDESVFAPRQQIIQFAEATLLKMLNQSRVGYTAAEVVNEVFEASRALYKPSSKLLARLDFLS